MVIFNQNAHYTYIGFGAEDSLDGFPYFRDAMTVITVSRHNRDYIRYAFPGASVHLTPNGVDTAVFRPLPKKRQIAYMPRKLPRDLVQVLQIVSGRGRLTGWRLLAIDGMHESQVTRALGESAIFLSSCEAEGFGLPPLEAAACGCAIVGYTGYAAQEFMTPELCDPVAQGDVLEFARTLEAVLARFERDAAAAEARAARHAEFVREHYSRQAEARSVVDTWSAIVSGSAVGGRCGPYVDAGAAETRPPAAPAAAAPAAA
jgi:glycosyltransferase involved in cell wall biosynthesis